MSTKKKRGLGHGLNEIVEGRRQAQEEQKARTKEILSQFQSGRSPDLDLEQDQPEPLKVQDQPELTPGRISTPYRTDTVSEFDTVPESDPVLDLGTKIVNEIV